MNPKAPEVDDLGRSNVSIQRAGAFAAVHAFGKPLCSNVSTRRAGLRGPSRIDVDNLDTGTCSLVAEHCSQLSPRGIGNGLGQHPTGQALHVQIFDSHPAEAVHQIAGNLMQAIAALVGNARESEPGRPSASLLCDIPACTWRSPVGDVAAHGQPAL